MPTLAPSLKIENTLARIELRRPLQANRLDQGDLTVLQEHLATVNVDSQVRVLLLSASGKHFCSGFNIGQVHQNTESAGALFESLTNAWEQARPVTIAAINGGVYGGATDLALACDFRLGVPSCDMFVPATQLGLHFYRGGMQRYVTRLGLNIAKRVLLAGERLDATAMLSCGFLDQIVQTDELHSRALALAQSIAGLAPLALLPMKQHLNNIARGTLDLEDLAADIARADASKDLAEGTQAWLEKRAPVFTGR